MLDENSKMDGLITLKFQFLSITKTLQDHIENNRVYEGHQLQPRGNESTSVSYIPDIPDDCLNATYCSYVPNYPEEYVSHLLIKVINITYVHKEYDLLK